MNIYEQKQRWKYILFVCAIIIGAGSLFYTNRLVSTLADNEREKIEWWAEATRLIANESIENDDITFFLLSFIESNTQIPVVLTNSNDSIITYNNLDSLRVKKKDYLQRSFEKMKDENDSIPIYVGNNDYQYLYYRNSNLLRKLAVFPYVQLAVIILFIGVSYIAFSISRKAEQNEVWTGLSKETAHQLGTPISSLAGWVEILKAREIDVSTVNELEKDTERLEKIADRFSKIGSKPALQENDIVQVIENSLNYLKSRKAKSIEFETILPSKAIMVPLNVNLFEWVIENLCKNAMDAMEGQGKVKIHCVESENNIIIDIEDKGRGIPKSKFKTVFKPGYTTKKRGWGLGLSLTKRIVESYHNGRVFVFSSEPGVRTVFRIILNK